MNDQAGETLQGFVRAVPGLTDATGVSDAELVQRLTLMESAKAALCAAQVWVTNELLERQLAATTAAGRREIDAYRSVGGQLALARHESQFRGRRLLGLARTLCTDLPHTLAALQAGETNERRVEMIVAACGFLTPAQRQTLDAEPAPQLASLGDVHTEATAHAIAYRLDPHGFTDRCRQAAKDRRITLRPAPDTMAYLTALLPVATAVACYAALKNHADTTIATGDPHRPHPDNTDTGDPETRPRSRDQVMADELLNRLTHGAITGVNDHGLPIRGHHQDHNRGSTAPPTARTSPVTPPPGGGADDGSDRPPTATGRPPKALPAAPDAEAPAERSEPAGEHRPDTTAEVVTEIELIITDRTLLNLSDEPAHLVGYGPIPAPLARDLILTGDPHHRTFFRRLYQQPHTGELLTMDSRRRTFPPGIKKFLRLRDQHCRMPWCGAPIRHGDHIQPAHTGGPTTLTNAQGLCAHCNYLVSLYGWTTIATSGGAITTTTPTGTTYHSPPRSPLSAALRQELANSSRLARLSRSGRRPLPSEADDERSENG